MKRSSLSIAISAALAGVAGFASLANAVDLSPDGRDLVALHPYYAVEYGRARKGSVKVRFLEGYNSREVVDFNLWLSRHDVWTAPIEVTR